MTAPIAVVGLGVCLPDASTPDALWTNLIRRHCSARPVPPGRWPLDPGAVLAPGPAPDKVLSIQGCFVDPLPAAVPALARRLPPGELDATFHLTARAGWEAWQHAVRPADPARSAVILGSIVLPTERCAAITERFFDSLAGAGGQPWRPRWDDALNLRVGGAPAAVLAHLLGIAGPAYTLDAACASSLYALKLGCDALARHEVDLVLAGGVSRPDALYTQMGFSQLRALSRRGRCTPFDGDADGLVVGEGAAVVALKRRDQAEREGDRVLGYIAGIGLSNDRAGGLLSPASEGQLRAMREAYRASGWRPETVQLIECHGTGTPVGDATELSSLRALWQHADTRHGDRHRAVIGSVKGNIGHLLSAAGAAGLAKVLLALEHGGLPPTAGFQRPGAGLELGPSPFSVLTELRHWTAPPGGGRRRAAVSAFGFGGTNAHLLVESAEVTADSTRGLVPRLVARGPTTSRPRESIAVVGLEARFGGLDGLGAFRARVLAPPDQAPAPAPPGNWWGYPSGDYAGYFLEHIDLPGAFKIPPAELAECLPQQLLMLLVAHAALARALSGTADGTGCPEVGIGERLGVYVGLALDLNTTNFTERWRWLGRSPRVPQPQAPPPLSANATMGSLGSITASRVARALGCGGPAFTICEEDCSGLRAAALAADALRAGEIDLAVAGAVDLAGEPRAALARRALRGRGAGGGGAPGEGAAALVLERESDARRHGRSVLALLGMARTEPRAATGAAGRQPPSECAVVGRPPIRVWLGDTGAASGAAALAQAVLALHSEPALGRAEVRGEGALGPRLRLALEAVD